MPEYQNQPMTDGIISLSEVVDAALVIDMNYQFYYDRIKTPANVNSKYFAMHYKEEQQEQWLTCSNVLSTTFTAIKTQEVIRQIQENLEGTIADEQHYRHGPSVKSTFGLSGYQIDVEDEPEVDRLLFQLLTNINCDLNLLTESKLTFNIINGFSGNHALQLNFGLLKKMTNRNTEGDDRVIPINNIFVLDAFTNRLIHDNHLTISIADVTNVQQAIQEKINSYKDAPFTETDLNTFLEKFPKRVGTKFSSMYENIPENLRSYYYITYILSVLLNNERNISLEIKLRKYITDCINHYYLVQPILVTDQSE